MRARLMDPGRDLEVRVPEGPSKSDVLADVGLDLVIDAMARQDELIADVARSVLLAPAPEVAVTVHRQMVLADALAAPEGLREIYQRTGEALDDARRVYGGFLRTPNSVLHQATKTLEAVLPALRWLRDVAERRGTAWRSPGLRALAAGLAAELDDVFFEEVDQHLAYVRFPRGTLMSAGLDPGLRGRDHVLRSPHRDERPLLRRLFERERVELTYRLPDRDEAGARALAELRDRGLASIADVTSQGVEHVLSFLRALRTELAFYIGCLNLAEDVDARGQAMVFPHPSTPPADGTFPLRFADLRDVALVLAGEAVVVGNDLDVDDARLVVVTGANRGGKSTFLRSIGQAQAMMQAGMFVAAEHYTAARTTRVLTHFRKEEDRELRSGTLDEELQRMSTLVDELGPGDLLLCNEPFASTNEREGSEIARQVLEPLVGAGVRVCVVTHLFDLADGWFRDERTGTVFLRAAPPSTAGRVFRLEPGGPLSTSFGVELYERVVGHTARGNGRTRRPDLGHEVCGDDESDRTPERSAAELPSE